MHENVNVVTDNQESNVNKMEVFFRSKKGKNNTSRAELAVNNTLLR